MTTSHVEGITRYNRHVNKQNCGKTQHLTKSAGNFHDSPCYRKVTSCWDPKHASEHHK